MHTELPALHLFRERRPFILVKVLAQGVCLNCCDAVLLNAFESEMGLFRVAFLQVSKTGLLKRLGPSQDSLTVVVEDLRLCSVKPCEDIERRFCFEVVSPTK